MKHKRLLSILTAALLLPALPGVQCTQELIRPITAEAAASVQSGQIGIPYRVSPNVILYFYPDMENHHFEVWGSDITSGLADVEIPDTVPYNGETFTVTAIRANAFKNQTNLRSINSNKQHIVSIGDRAFYGCSNLTAVNLAAGTGYSAVEYIGASAFKNCSLLNNICFATKTDEIGPHAFWNCTSLSSIYLDDIKTLGTAAFYNCTNLQWIDLRNSQLTKIDEFMFWHCIGIKTVSLPETLTEIGKQAFDSCTGIETVYIPDEVSTLGTGAFLSCTALRNVLMPESIISVGDHAFFNCPNMKFFVCKNPNAFIDKYAVGWHLENGIAFRNDDFVVWSTGSGRVKNYARNNNLTYHDVSEAPKIAKERYADYEWSATNNEKAWGSNGKYYINDAHSSHASNASGLLENDFDGICTGLAIVSALTSSGRLSVSDYAPGYNKLSDITVDNNGSMPNFVKSYVTTVWSKRSDLLQSNFHNHYYIGQNSGFSKEALRYAEYITYGADTAVISFQGNINNHSMVCIGLEFKEYADDRNTIFWNNKDARLMIYDVNHKTYNIFDCLFIKFSDGSWSAASTRYGYTPSSHSISLDHSFDRSASFFDNIKYSPGV